MWKVTTADAHAWPELYIRLVGWLRFEPTPGGPTGQGTATAPPYAPRSGTGVLPPPGSTPSTGPGAKTRFLPGNPGLAKIKGLESGGSAVSRATRQSIMPQVLLAVVIVLGLVLITPMAARWLIRHRRLRLLGRPGRRQPGGPRLDPGADLDAELAHAAWCELRDNLADFGLAGRVSESPRALGGRIATTLHLDPAAREALDRIVRAEERARYATVPLGPGTLRADTGAVRRALSREADWAARWRAWLLPASTLTPIRRGLQHSLDVFGWMDVAGLRLRERLRHQG